MKKETPQMKRCRKALFKLGWLHPFFAIPIGRCKLVEDSNPQQCPTAFVTLRGKIHFSPAFFETLSDAEVMGVLAHEICHPLFGHHGRQAGRDGRLWNIVTDMAINQGLKDSGITLPDCALYPAPEWATWNAERIYDELAQNPEKQPQPQPGQGEDGDGQPQPTAGCGIEPDPDGSDEGASAGDSNDDSGSDDDSAAPGDGKSDSELEREWREVAIQAATMDAQASRGSGKGSALARITEIPAPKVRWGSVVRKGAAAAITAAGRDQQSWTRRGRRSAVRGPQFPGWIKNAPKLAIVIDTSGSMSDEILAQAVAEVLGALKASEIPAYLVTHDHGVQWEGWVSPRTRPTDVTATFKGRGGTCAREAYRCVEQQRDRFDVFIHLTDCHLSWPQFPANTRQRIIARMGRGGSLVEGPEGQRHRLVDVQI